MHSCAPVYRSYYSGITSINNKSYQYSDMKNSFIFSDKYINLLNGVRTN